MKKIHQLMQHTKGLKSTVYVIAMKLLKSYFKMRILMLHPYFIFANVLAVAYRYICVFHFLKKKKKSLKVSGK